MRGKKAFGYGIALALLATLLGLAGCSVGTDPKTGAATIIVNDGTNPVEGAAVTLGDDMQTTDAKGQAAFVDVPAGKYTVTATKDGYATGTVTVTVAAGETAEAMITLSARYGSAVITVNDGADPINEANVTLNGQTLTTGSDGQVTFTNVPVGDQPVTAAKSGYVTGSATITIADGETETLILSLTRAGNATITVNDGTDPIVGANVTLNGQTLATDGSGTASFPDLPPGDYTASAAKNGYTSGSAPVKVIAGETAPVTISLTRQIGSATITVDDGANPISGAEVTLDGETLTTNAQGKATFINVLTGSYTVSVHATGYDSVNSEIEVAADVTVSKTISLSRQYGDVSVWVHENLIWTAIGNVNVALGGQTALTNVQGRADFTNVPAGTHTATASSAGFTTKSLSVTVTKGRTLDTVFVGGASYEILMDRVAGVFLVTALKYDGSPLVGATVAMWNYSNPSQVWQGVTDASGRVTFSSVITGNWRITITPASGLYPMGEDITVTESKMWYTKQSEWWK